MKQGELRKLSPIECGEASVLLCQEAAYLQSEINQSQIIVNWCKKEISKLIATEIDNVGSKYTPYEYRRILAIKQNNTASELDKILIAEESIIESVVYMANSLRSLSTVFDSLQKTKRGLK
jgi:vacuolar-type H+-ATPase subunit D/Vma8